MIPTSRFRLPSFATLPVALALASGCTYVTQGDYEDKLSRLDADGDGSPFKDDCDDNDDTRSPDFDEVPYDGIDNDCDGFDTVDADDDSYPGIAEADWVAQHEGVEWPPSVKSEPVDCDDEDRNVFPNKASDPPYDGIDADCGCDNDFDVDGDGDIPAEHEGAFQTFASSSCYAGPTPTYADCDDFDALTFGGAPGEVCYDGIDTDCDGSNDFDCDGDDFMPDDVDASDYQQFLNQYFDGNEPNGWGSFGDCDDDDGGVHPGASDTLGDGIDSDCGCNTAWDNDFDGDGDGWIPAGQQAALDAYILAWCSDQTIPDDGGEGDCNDNNPSINPGQLDTLGDNQDSDCDGGNNTSRFHDGGLGWAAPRPPAVTKTTNNFVLVTAADVFTQGVTNNNHAGVALAFDTNAGPGDEPVFAPILWQGQVAEDPIGAAVDAAASGTSFWASTVYTKQGQSFLIAVEYTYNGAGYSRGPADVAVRAPYDSLAVDLALDNNDRPWAWSVGSTVLQALHGDGTINPDTGASIALTNAETVFIDDPSIAIGTAVHCDATDCQSKTFDGATITAAGLQPWSGTPGIAARESEDVIAVVDPVNGVVVDDGASSFTVLAAYPVHYAQAVLAPNGDLYLASVLDDDGNTELWLSYGDPSVGTITHVPQTLDPSLVPTGVAVYVSATRVFLAVSAIDGGGNDYVGWTFLGPAP